MTLDYSHWSSTHRIAMLGRRSAPLLYASLTTACILAGCRAEDGGARPTIRHEAAEYGLSFAYPDDLYLLERNDGAGGIPQLSLVLVEDNATNRAYLAGTLTEPTEGPPMITIDVYANPTRAPAAEWIATQTNWILTDKTPELAQIGDYTYVTFFWDGLYAGKSSAIAVSDLMYVFSVTWISDRDRLLDDFSDVLDSVRLTQP